MKPGFERQREPGVVLMKMPETIDERLIAPCGIDCMVCYAHLKKKKPCAGCLVSDDNKTARCMSCAIKHCAVERGLVHCFDCPDHPCERIKRLDRSYRKRYGASLVENAKRIREAGAAAFLREDRARWVCGCGGVISLHDGRCSECGLKKSEGR